MNEIEIFKPGLAELKALADRVKDLTISGVDDVAGYEAVKKGQKELADMRILITKFGKSKRDEAIAWNKEVLRQEKMHLEIIVPVEDELKAKREAIDEEKKMAERKVLLPTRIKMLEEIGVQLLDAEILRMDEDEFARYYSGQKMFYLESEDRKRKAEELEKKRAEELEQAKAKAAEDAIVAERNRVEAENIRIAEEALAKSKAMQEEQAKVEKNKKYKAWVEKNKLENLPDGDWKIEREGDTFKLWKLVDEITIN